MDRNRAQALGEDYLQKLKRGPGYAKSRSAQTRTPASKSPIAIRGLSAFWSAFLCSVVLLGAYLWSTRASRSLPLLQPAFGAGNLTGARSACKAAHTKLRQLEGLQVEDWSPFSELEVELVQGIQGTDRSGTHFGGDTSPTLKAALKPSGTCSQYSRLRDSVFAAKELLDNNIKSHNASLKLYERVLAVVEAEQSRLRQRRASPPPVGYVGPFKGTKKIGDAWESFDHAGTLLDTITQVLPDLQNGKGIVGAGMERQSRLLADSDDLSTMFHEDCRTFDIQRFTGMFLSAIKRAIGDDIDAEDFVRYFQAL